MSIFQLDPDIEAAIVFRAQPHLSKPYPNYEHYYLLHHIFNTNEDDDHSKLVDLVLSGSCPFYMFKNISINLINAIESKPCKCLLALYCSFANLPIKSVKCQQLTVQYFDDLIQYLLKQQILPVELKLFLASCLEFQLVPKPYIMNLSKHIQYSLPNDSMPSSPSLLNVLLAGNTSTATIKVELKPNTIPEFLQAHEFSMKQIGIVLSKFVCNPLEYQFDIISRTLLSGAYNDTDFQPLVDAIDLEINKTNKSEADQILNLLIALTAQLKVDFPLHLFVNKQWSNQNTQALYVLLLSVKELVLPNVKKITNYTLEQLYHTEYHEKFIGLHYFPIFENCMILGTNFYPQVLEEMIKNYTDLFLIGSIQFNEGYNLFSALIPQYLQHPFLHILLNDPQSHVFMRTWLNELYKQSPTHLKLTLESIKQGHSDVVSELIQISQAPLQFDLVCWFTDQVDLWFKEQIFAHKDTAMRQLIDFIHSKTTNTGNSSEADVLQKLGPAAVVPFTVANTRAIKNVLSGYKGFELSPSTQKFVLEAMDQISQMHGPQQQQPAMGDVENEARALFSKLFRDLYPPDQLVVYLLSAQHNPQLLTKVVQLLLQEQAYFQQYPQQELEIASEFMGQLIKHKAITGVLYSETNKLLRHCLKQQPNDKLFIFAHRVVLLGTPVLLLDTDFATFMSTMSHLRDFPDLRPFFQTNKNLPKPPAYQQPPSYQKQPKPPKSLPIGQSILKLVTVNQKVLEHVSPNTKSQDKILFIINNLSPNNIEAKSKELLPLLNLTLIRWLANYMVVKRAILEPNFHHVYLAFIQRICCLLDLSTMEINDALLPAYIREHLNRKYYVNHILYKCVLYESFFISEKLLSDKENHQSGGTSAKQLLKNIGSWIGLLTLHQDKPLIHTHLNMKQLLLSSVVSPTNYPSAVVVPFVCQVLQQAQYSTIFHMPNPFMHVHLRCLKQIYENSNLAQGLLLDIEILFKQLNYRMVDLPEPEAHDEMLEPPPEPQAEAEFQLNLPQATTNDLMQKVLNYAIEQSLKEILAPVVERSVTIANISTRELIFKDFKFETNKQKVTKAAQVMVQSLAGSLALVTCKEPLKQSILNHLKTVLLQQGLQFNESECLMLVNNQLDGICELIKQQAEEQALLTMSIDINPHNNGFGTNNVVLPNALQNTNGVTDQQYAIYMGFGAHQDTLYEPQPIAVAPVTSPNGNSILINLTNQLASNIHSNALYKSLKQALTENTANNAILLEYVAFLIHLLYTATDLLVKQLMCNLLKETIEMNKVLIKEFTSWFYLSQNKAKFDVPCLMLLCGCGLIRLSDLDVILPDLLEVEHFYISFSKSLISRCVQDDLEDDAAFVLELFQTITALNKLQMAADGTEFMTNNELLSAILFDPESPDVENANSNLMTTYYAGIFSKWCKLTQMSTWHPTCSHLFITRALQILDSDEKLIHFTRIALEQSIDGYLLTHLEFSSVDALSLFIIEILSLKKLRNQHVQLFNKIIACVAMVLIHVHETSRFNAKGFTRLFSSLMSGIHDHVTLQSDYLNMSLLLSEIYHTIQPQVVPGFAFGWLCLISHRQFIPSMLSNNKLWHQYHVLLVDLLCFLLPFTRDLKMNEASRLLYKGTLRLLLVLLHDYPEFLCCYYYNLCMVIPPICIQLKNLLLSCFPRDLRLPDPFTPGLKIEELPEILIQPVVVCDYLIELSDLGIKDGLEHYLRTKSPLSFIPDLLHALTEEHDDLNIRGLNAVLFSLGVNYASQQTQGDIKTSGQYEFIKTILMGLDSEGRYLGITCMANHLRYPNAHSFFFNRVLLTMFEDDLVKEVVREQITRVLLERLIANRPHPWCLLTTFVELIKNPKYAFWSHGFTKCAPDIERLFESVARSIS